MRDKYVIGLDFGTDSARGILLNTHTGEVVAKSVGYFKRWSQGLYCDPLRDQYRQHPLDYIEAIDEIFDALLQDRGKDFIHNIVAIGTNSTGSTPVAVDEQCRPLALLEEFHDNPNAMFILWKDHTAVAEADEINALAKKWPVDYTKYSGGIYSSEWFWSKIMHINRKDIKVREKAFTWLEQSDWIPTYLTGINKPAAIKRNRCAAGHKAMWNEEHGGLPSSEFLCSLDPSFYHLVNRFYKDTYTSDEVFGTISPYFVKKYGFHPGTVISVGGIDAHHGAVGSGIQSNTLVKVMGTSTCDMLVLPQEANPPMVDGICGQVDGSILPEMVGYEAGQSAFGDIYKWFKKLLISPLLAVLDGEVSKVQQDKLNDQLLDFLTLEAAKLPLTDDDLIFTDYHNGRRTPDADFTLKATAYGINLATGPAHIFKALVEGTAFGSKAILERFKEHDISIQGVLATGGIAVKSAYVVQVLADILAMEIEVVDNDQTGALGSAVFAAVGAGLFNNVRDAQKQLGAKTRTTFTPRPTHVETYQRLYKKYRVLTNIKL